MFANFWKRDTISVDSEITSFLGAVDVPAALEAIPKFSLIDFLGVVFFFLDKRTIQPNCPGEKKCHPQNSGSHLTGFYYTQVYGKNENQDNKQCKNKHGTK